MVIICTFRHCSSLILIIVLSIPRFDCQSSDHSTPGQMMMTKYPDNRNQSLHSFARILMTTSRLLSVRLERR